MGVDTSIAWTDHTFNPWWGCTKVSPGCDHCYAEAFDKRVGGAHWGVGVPRRTFTDTHWEEPLKWNRLAAKAGVVEKVFCGSMCDVMDPEGPDDLRRRLWTLIDATPHLFWQLLTKRPHLYRRYLPLGGFRYDNVALGATTEAQPQFDARIGELALATAVGDCNRTPLLTFISYEPALGPIIMGLGYKPNWVIFGGETGANPRPMRREWADAMKAECAEHGIPFFMKQMSARTPGSAADLIPAELLVRQFPPAMLGVGA